MASTSPTYTEVLSEYTITSLGDDGRISTYALAPRKRGGRVKNLTLAVDDRAALIVRIAWSYADGGRLSFDQNYVGLGPFHLLSKARISARFTGYSVDGTLQLSNYQPNAYVPPSAPAEDRPHALSSVSRQPAQAFQGTISRNRIASGTHCHWQPAAIALQPSRNSPSRP